MKMLKNSGETQNGIDTFLEVFSKDFEQKNDQLKDKKKDEIKDGDKSYLFVNQKKLKILKINKKTNKQD